MLISPLPNNTGATSTKSCTKRNTKLRVALPGKLLSPLLIAAVVLTGCTELPPPAVAEAQAQAQAQTQTLSTSAATVPGTPIARDPATLPAEVRALRPYLRGNPRYGWQVGQLGTPNDFWNQRADRLSVHPDSAAVTTYLAHVSRNDKQDPRSEFFGQFDLGKKANNENYSFHILEADSTTPRYDFTPRLRANGFPEDEFYSPHCDQIAMPVPANGRLQGEANYQCTGNGDCHLYVVNSEEGRIYEQWRADNPGSDKRRYAGGCTNVWDLRETQPENLRGLSCSSANAAGLPYIPMLITPGEIKAGVIRHALAFTLPNGWVERDVYARPATHNPIVSVRWGDAEPGPGKPMRYGSHFRLDQGFRISPRWPASLRVILQALKDYGMYHIDGGPRMIVTSNDAFSEHHWDDPDIALNPHDMTTIAGLSWKDFELVSVAGAAGSMRSTDCRRRPQREKAPRGKALF